MSDMHKMNKNNIFDFVLTLPAEGSVFFIPIFPHRPCPSRAQNRKFNIADQGMRVSNIYSSKCSFRMEWKSDRFCSVIEVLWFDSEKRSRKRYRRILFFCFFYLYLLRIWIEKRKNEMELRATLKEKKRIVIKVGTSTVTYAKTGNINLEKLEKFVRVLINLRNRGKEIIVVSSGAVGIGKNVLGISEKPAGSVKQACAAVGQGRLLLPY